MIYQECWPKNNFNFIFIVIKLNFVLVEKFRKNKTIIPFQYYFYIKNKII